MTKNKDPETRRSKPIVLNTRLSHCKECGHAGLHHTFESAMSATREGFCPDEASVLSYEGEKNLAPKGILLILAMLVVLAVLVIVLG